MLSQRIDDGMLYEAPEVNKNKAKQTKMGRNIILATEHILSHKTIFVVRSRCSIGIYGTVCT